MRRFPMLDSHFKKEEFKKAVKENVKMLYRKTIDEANLPGRFSGCKRCYYR